MKHPRRTPPNKPTQKVTVVPVARPDRDPAIVIVSGMGTARGIFVSCITCDIMRI